MIDNFNTKFSKHSIKELFMCIQVFINFIIEVVL